MSMRLLSGMLWAFFALLMLITGQQFLAACDLGFRPLFGMRYCEAPAATPDFATEIEKGRHLRVRIHEAELRLASLPPCTVCIPQEQQPPGLAVIIDLSRSMYIPIDLSPSEARDMRVAESDPDHATRQQRQLEEQLLDPAHGRKSRIAAVKEELPRVLSSIGERAVTVISYRDCGEISSQPAMTSQLPSIIGGLPRPYGPLSNKGGTPIGKSLQLAAQRFAAGADGHYSGAILLVTDGGESCGANYCAIAEEIARTKPGLVINVVDLTGYTDVACVAAATNGRVFRRTADTSIADLLKRARGPVAPLCRTTTQNPADIDLGYLRGDAPKP